MSRKPPKGKSLAEVNPDLAKEWHTLKNGELTPFNLLMDQIKKFGGNVIKEMIMNGKLKLN